MATEFTCIALKSPNPNLNIPITVFWRTPQPHWHKLNSDGSTLGYPGLAGGGGLIRDHLADELKVSAGPLGGQIVYTLSCGQ